ncbi:hypothetical protein H8959_021914 [Pygathrix nigripes]
MLVYCNKSFIIFTDTLLNHFDSFQERTFQEQVSDTENNLNQGPSLVEAIFKILYHCSFSPQTFANVFVSYMEEEQLWDFLYNIPVSTCMEYELEVIRCLRLALTDAVKDTVQQIVSVMSSRRNYRGNTRYNLSSQRPDSRIGTTRHKHIKNNETFQII